MKRFFSTLLCAASMALASCSPTIYKGEDSKAKLEKQDYHVVLLSELEAKVLIAGINFSDVTVKSVVSAEKGTGDDHDIFLGFYFDSIKEAEKFNAKNSNENLALLSSYAEAVIGKNLEAKVGSHNNVCYVGTETSFKIAL